MFNKHSQFRIGLLSLLLCLFIGNTFAQTLSLAENEERIFYGRASYYGDEFAGNRTACGEIFVPSKMTAAHRFWPFHTMVKITNLNNGRSVIVRINDRGPFIEGRQIDVSKGVAEALGFIRAGVTDVRMEVISWGKNDPELYVKMSEAENSMLLSKTEPKKTKTIPKQKVAKTEPKSNKKVVVEPKSEESTITIALVSDEVKSPKISLKIEASKKPLPDKPLNVSQNNTAQNNTKATIEMKRSRWLCMESDTLSGWCIQIGAFALKANAMITYDKVLELTKDWVCIQEIDRNESLLYRVIASKTMDYNSCISNLEIIRTIYPEAFITSYVNLRLTASN